MKPFLLNLAASACLTGMFTSTSLSAATYKNVYTFKGPPTDGVAYDAALTYQDGLFYGATVYGGPNRCHKQYTCGVIFSLDPSTGTEKVLYNFVGGRFGQGPDGHLLYAGGNLYGTTSFQGKSGYPYCGCGVVFKFNLKTGKLKILHAFGGNDIDGSGPSGPLVIVNGILYGTTQAGGVCQDQGGCGGTVYKLDLATNEESILHAFTGGADGTGPMGGLVYENKLLYGTTIQGGGTGCGSSFGCGTIYSVDPASGAETVMHSFGDGTQGSYPEAQLAYASGLFYGTTAFGGTEAGCGDNRGCGTIFSFDPSTNAETILYNFGDGPLGYFVTTRVVYQKNKLYGTSTVGQGTGAASVFELSLADGKLKDFVTFPYTGEAYDVTVLNGNIYGTNSGDTPDGLIFEVTP